MWRRFQQDCRPKVLSIYCPDKGCGHLFVFHHSRKKCSILRKIYKWHLPLARKSNLIWTMLCKINERYRVFLEQFCENHALPGRLCTKKFLLFRFATVIAKVYRLFSIDGRHVFSHVSNLIVQISITSTILNNRRIVISKSRSNLIFRK